MQKDSALLQHGVFVAFSWRWRTAILFVSRKVFKRAFETMIEQQLQALTQQCFAFCNEQLSQSLKCQFKGIPSRNSASRSFAKSSRLVAARGRRLILAVKKLRLALLAKTMLGDAFVGSLLQMERRCKHK